MEVFSLIFRYYRSYAVDGTHDIFRSLPTIICRLYSGVLHSIHFVIVLFIEAWFRFKWSHSVVTFVAILRRNLTYMASSVQLNQIDWWHVIGKIQCSKAIILYIFPIVLMSPLPERSYDIRSVKSVHKMTFELNISSFYSGEHGN